MILITGINGEMGNALVKKFHDSQSNNIIGLDIKSPSEDVKPFLHKCYVGDIRDKDLINEIFTENTITSVYHLAVILSTKAESIPFLSHEVNVNGLLNLIEQILMKKQFVKFFFPSSIAVYTIDNKNNKPITEEQFCSPNNMYGCNKLYCEKLGAYFSGHAKGSQYLDFRSIRFCGIISADTLPQGGTSDYAPEMIHAAVQNKDYTCFVRSDSCIPFMVMPDAINGIIKLMNANKNSLNQDVYHIQAFAPTVQDIYEKISPMFPAFTLKYDINSKRQALVDSWPSKLNQTSAEKDWGWKAEYDFNKAFEEYLIPKIKKHYNR